MDNPILKDKFGRDVAIKDGDILALIPHKKFRTREFEIISNIYNYLRFFKGDKDGK